MARPRTVEPRNLHVATLGHAIESVIAGDKDMNVGTVADRSGLDEKQIGILIRGQGNPTYETLRKLCRGLGVTVSELQLLAEQRYERLCGRSPQSLDSFRKG